MVGAEWSIFIDCGVEVDVEGFAEFLQIGTELFVLTLNFLKFL